jgi:hypothetical protein
VIVGVTWRVSQSRISSKQDKGYVQFREANGAMKKIAGMRSHNSANGGISTAVASASYGIVRVGFTAAAVTKMLPSTMNRFLTSWLRPHSFTTDRAGSVPIRAVPIKCQPPSGTGASDQTSCAPAARRISLARATP